MSTHDPPTQTRVSTLELFFDLVFVFTITQLARLVSVAHGWADLGSAALILTIAFWMYGGFAWLTNNVGTDGLSRRLLMLLGMCAYFVMALAIPRAVGEDGLAFGVAFFIVTVVHTLLFSRAPGASWGAIMGFAPYNFVGASFAVASGFIDPHWRWLGWLAAFAMFLMVTLRRGERRIAINSAHFAERHGLVIIVAIGESVVALGAGVDQVPVRWPLIRVVALGFALCAALWWTYFDGDDERGEHALGAADFQRRARLGILAYGYGHLGMIAGIVCVAAGLHDAIASLGGRMSEGHSWILAAGISLYLVSNKLFRVMLSIGSSRWRSAAALFALAVAPLGWQVSAAAEIGALVALLVLMLVLERKPLVRAAR